MASYIGYLRKNENAEYGIEFPDFPECVSAAPRSEYAGAMASDDLARHVTALMSFGLPVPPPTPLELLADDLRRGDAELIVVDLDLDFLANPNVSMYHNL